MSSSNEARPSKARRVLITGGAGFIGHHFVEHLLKNTDWNIVVWDKLSYSGKLDRLRDVEAFNKDRVLILTTDFSQPVSEGVARETGDVDFIIHMGAESHVDRSIVDAEPFVRSNVLGTHYMLEYARTLPGLRRFFYFSTDEVHGPALQGESFKESDPHRPTNPYAATKSGGEMLVMACRHTHGLPATITRTMNVYGERQDPEKFIPKCIQAIRDGEKITIHADQTRTVPGSRSYIHARNVADAYLFLMQQSEKLDSSDFNIVGEQEVNNLQLARMIAIIMGRELTYELVDFHSSRPGHDLRYMLSGDKLRRWGWEPPKTLRESLEKTVQWTLDNPRWLEP